MKRTPGRTWEPVAWMAFGLLVASNVTAWQLTFDLRKRYDENLAASKRQVDEAVRGEVNMIRHEVERYLQSVRIEEFSRPYRAWVRRHK